MNGETNSVGRLSSAESKIKELEGEVAALQEERELARQHSEASKSRIAAVEKRQDAVGKFDLKQISAVIALTIAVSGVVTALINLSISARVAESDLREVEEMKMIRERIANLEGKAQ